MDLVIRAQFKSRLSVTLTSLSENTMPNIVPVLTKSGTESLYQTGMGKHFALKTQMMSIENNTDKSDKYWTEPTVSDVSCHLWCDN